MTEHWIGMAALSAVWASGLATAQETVPGVTFRVYQVENPLERIPGIAPDQTPNFDKRSDTIDFGAGDFGGLKASIVSHVIAELVIEEPGAYVFRLTSDDGSRLTLDARLLIDHDGWHGATPALNAPVDLKAGRHPLFIEHFDSGGARRLLLEWQRDGEDGFTIVPTSNLLAEQDLTRVTSPGFKRVEDGRRPGDGAPLKDVHPSWTLSTIRPPGFEPKVGAMAFLPDGRLVVGTFDPLQRDDRELPDIDSKEPDALFAIGNLDAENPTDIAVERIATDLYEPTGICIVDGDLYVAHRKSVERLTDRDADGFYETHETIGEGWEGWNYHQFAFGLVHRDGKLYTALSTAMAPPPWEGMESNAGPNGPMRGGLIEIDIESGVTSVIAGGFRTPNGLGLTPAGDLIYLDNQGTWMPTSQLVEVIPGRFYGHYNWTRYVPKLGERFPTGGHPSALSDRQRTPASVFFPQNEVSNSPTQPLPITSGPFKGQVLVGELTAGGVRRVMLERVNGQLQGALFRFTQGFESGVNRMAWGPDGSLVVGGIGAGGNWNWRGTQFGLQRLTPNGATAFEMHSVRAQPDGFRIVFSEPVDPEWLADPTNYLIRSWTYEPTAVYGGPKVNNRAHHVLRATPGTNGLAVTLALEGLEPGRCYHLRTDPVSQTGEAIWSTEAWYTLNQIPRGEPVRESSIGGEPVRPDALGVGVLAPASAATLLGAGSSPCMRALDSTIPPPPLSQDDLISGPGYTTVGMGSGDLYSSTFFSDARLHIEWFCPPGGEGQLAGNSGVYLQDRYEVQVLGTLAGDRALEANEAGAIYGIKPPDTNASAGPGAWQAYDIWFRAPRFVSGKKTEDARITMYWNGVLVHDDVAIPHPTGAKQNEHEIPAPDRGHAHGPLRLQDHASGADAPVRYRNIWIEPLDVADQLSRYEPGAWTDLFRDTSPTDWKICGGGATFELDDGVLTGTTAPNIPNSFFTTTRTYADFELIYEAKVDPRLNSGVQIRSDIVGGATNPNGPLRGYQVELDPSDRAFTAGIYEERFRGWLHPLHAAPSPRRAFRPNDWNEIRVLCVGPIIRTWINGIPAAEVFDVVATDGHIGFQVHGVGDMAEPLTVQFRDARIREYKQ